MKKSLAVIAASALGVVAAGASVGAPAAAAVVPQCDNFGEQTSPVFDVTDVWFAECVPQYGFGKVEFTIESDVSFPAEFAHLDDDSVETTTDLNPALETYMGDTTKGAFLDLAFEDETTTTQRYRGVIAAPITSTAAVVDESDVPEAVATACMLDGLDGIAAFHITFGSTSTTFTQTVAGVPWVYTVGGTPKSTYLFFNDEYDFCYVDEDGENAITDPELVEVAFLLVPPFGFAVSDESPIFPLGAFSRTAVPALAATGADATAPLAIAGGLLGIGVLTFGLGAALRRKTRTS
ncbi:MAG: hypothetical protein ABL886_01005 [Rhodoglobus sp.]